MGEVNPAAKAFGNTLLDLKGVMGSLHDIKTLLGNKKKFEDSLKFAQNPGYKDWLPEALRTTDQLLVWGGLRALANSYKLYDDVNKLTELEDKGIAIRAHMQADLQQLKGLFGDRLASQWNHMAEIIQDLSHADPAFFADEKHGLLYNGGEDGRDFHGEWLAHVEESRKREHLERRGLLTQKSAADLRKDIATIERLWAQREKEYQNFCKNLGLTVGKEGSRDKFAVNIAGKSWLEPLELETSVVNFLDYFEGLVKMCIPEIHSQSGCMPRFWVHFTDCIFRASRKKVSVVKRIYPDNFRSTCEEQIQVMYGE